VGETGILPVAPAIANAVRDATGVRITRLPLTPERVLEALGAASDPPRRPRGERSPRVVHARDEDLLLDVLREQVGVTSVREGCGVGACGACTVLVEGASVSSCLALAVDYDGAAILTVEGAARGRPGGALFVEAGALQCGYCIPGFVMMTHELLAEQESPSPEAVRAHLAGKPLPLRHLLRDRRGGRPCGAHARGQELRREHPESPARRGQRREVSGVVPVERGQLRWAG